MLLRDQSNPAYSMQVSSVIWSNDQANKPRTTEIHSDQGCRSRPVYAQTPLRVHARDKLAKSYDHKYIYSFLQTIHR